MIDNPHRMAGAVAVERSFGLDCAATRAVGPMWDYLPDHPVISKYPIMQALAGNNPVANARQGT